MSGTVNESKVLQYSGKPYYEIRCELPRSKDGKRRQLRRGKFTSRTKADKALRKILTEIDEGVYVHKDDKQEVKVEDQVKELTVKDILIDYLEGYIRKLKRETTYESFNSYASNHILPHIGDIEIKDLKAYMINEFYTHLLTEGRKDGMGGLSGTTVLQVHRILYTAFKESYKSEKIESNVMIKVKTPKKNHYRASFLEDDELQAFIDGFKESDLFVAVMIALFMGLRRGEVLGLTWECINFKKSTMTIKQARIPTKKKKKFGELKNYSSYRELAIPETLLRVLLNHKVLQENQRKFWGSDYTESDFIVTRFDGTLDKPRNFSKRYAELRNKMNLKKVRFHDLRHTFGSLLLNEGMELKIISDLYGHSGIQVTADIYAKTTKKIFKHAANKMDEIIKGNVQL